MSDRVPDDAEIAAIRKMVEMVEYPTFARFGYEQMKALLRALDAVTAERDAWRATAMQRHYASELPR